MEVECPKCSSMVEVGDPEEEIICPGCTAALEIQMGGSGFAIVSAVDEPGEADGEISGPPPPSALNDPVLADHSQWKLGAVFAVLLGLIGLACAGYAGFQDYRAYGMYAVTRGDGALTLWLIVGGSMALAAGGAIVFMIVSSESKKYLKALEKKQSMT